MKLDESQMAKVYADAQKASGIEVGDWVRLKEDVEPAKAGRIYTVTFIHDDGISLADDVVCSVAPYYLLEKVDYTTAQAASGLKVGDRVRVRRKAEHHEKGWRNTWNPEMDSYIGKVLVITRIEDGCVGILLNHSVFYFPFFVLEKVEAKEEPAPEESQCPFKCGDEVLVRDDPAYRWVKDILYDFLPSHPFPYRVDTGGYGWKYCIPYAGNESLEGTSKSPDEVQKEQVADAPKSETACPFKKGDLVLVRDSRVKAWIADRFESFDPSNEDGEFYITTFSLWSECIPFEGNQHLIGTTDLPSEEQKTPQPAEDGGLKAGDLVLVRDSDSQPWQADIFVKWSDNKLFGPYRSLRSFYRQAIPFAGNEHLLP